MFLSFILHYPAIVRLCFTN